MVPFQSHVGRSDALDAPDGPGTADTSSGLISILLSHVLSALVPDEKDALPYS